MFIIWIMVAHRDPDQGLGGGHIVLGALQTLVASLKHQLFFTTLCNKYRWTQAATCGSEPNRNNDQGCLTRGI